MREALERFDKVGPFFRSIDSFQIVQYRGKKSGQFPAGLPDELIGRLLGKELGNIEFLSFFKMLSSPLGIAAGHVFDAAYGMIPEDAIVA